MTRTSSFPWVVLVALLTSAVACTSESASERSCAGQIDTPPTPGPHEAIGWKKLRASSGGRVDIPDGAWLEVPPGALPCDATLTVRISKTPDSGVKTYLLEPSGMQFEKPVVLNVPYAEPSPGVEPLITALSSSASSPVIAAGAEQTNWQWVDVAQRDEEKNVIGLSLEHFTFVYVAVHVDENAYLVVDLPDRYLRPGDALFTLTAHDDAKVQSSWYPGHVALVRSIPDESKAQSNALLIEATPPRVRSVVVGMLKDEPGHIYLGSRRPPDPVFGITQRSDATISALVEVGDPYNLIGQGNLDTFGWSCVGLVEYAWDSAGRGVLDEWREVTAATPLEMFRATRPIAELTERARQPISLPVYGVTLSPDSPIVARTFRGFYTKKHGYEIVAKNLPEGATFSGSAEQGYGFEWTPTIEQGCVHVGGKSETCKDFARKYEIPLEMSAHPEGLLTPWLSGPIHVSQTLTVSVTGGTAVKTVGPADALIGQEHTISFEIGPDALVHSLDFIDEETGQPPTDTPFPNQSLVVNYKGCASGSCMVNFEITNSAATVPAGTKTYRLTADYSTPPAFTGP